MDYRRKHPRFEVDPGLPGTMRDGTRVTLVEISAQGCRVHAQKAVPPGTGEVLRFHVGPGQPIVSVRASAVHTMPVPWIFSPSELVGFQLEADSSNRLARALAPMLRRPPKRPIS